MKKNLVRMLAVLTALLIAVSCVGASAVAEEPAPNAVAQTAGEQTEATEEAVEQAEPIVFTVEFITDDEIKEVKLNQGETLKQPLDPVKDGYTFLYWYVAKPKQEEIKPFVFDREVVCDLELVAQFAEIEVIIEDAEPAESEEEIFEEPAADAPKEEPSAETAGGEALDILIIDDEDPAPADGENVAAEEYAAGEPTLSEGESTDEDVVVVEDEPAAEATEVKEIAEEEVPLAGPAPQRTVSVQCDAGAQMAEGTMITLTGVLSGFDGCDIAYQWQCDSGNGWENVEGANSLTYSFSANAQTLNYGWRLSVTVLPALSIAG